MSSSTTSGRKTSASSMASGPEWVTRHSCPHSLMIRPRLSAEGTLSSTTSTRRNVPTVLVAAAGAPARPQLLLRDRERDDELAALAQPCAPGSTGPDASGPGCAPGSARCPGRPGSRASDWSTWVNRPKIASCISGAMPMPLSLMRISTSSPALRGRSISPPLSVYLTALFRRLFRTCSSRTGSAQSRTGSSGSVTRRSCCLAARWGRTVSTERWIRAESSPARSGAGSCRG